MGTNSEQSRIGHGVILAALCILFLAVTRKLLIPVGMGLLISMIFRPIYLSQLRLLKQRAGLAAFECTVLLTVGVVLPMTVIGSILADDIAHLVQSVKDLVQSQQQGQTQIMQIPLVSQIYEKLKAWTGLSDQALLERGKQIGIEALSFITKFVGGVATSLPGKVAAVIFFLISFYYGLADGSRFANFLRGLLPYSEQEIDELFLTVQGISRGVILGALTAGIVQGIIIGFAYWFTGIPRPFFFGVLTVIFSFIPLFGSLPTGIGGVIYLIVTHHYAAAVGMGIAFFLASISDNIVKPWVLRGQAELHPLLGLISVLGGLGIFGFSGIFFGPLIAALTVAVLQLTRQDQKQTV